MRTSIVVTLLVLLAVAVAGYWLYGSWKDKKKQDPEATFIKPRLLLSAFNVTSITPDRTNLTMRMRIDNPAPIGFTVDSVRYTIYMAGQEVMQSRYAKAVAFKGHDTSEVALPVVLQNQPLVRVLRALKEQNKDSTDYRIVTAVYTGLPFLKHKPLRYDETVRGPSFLIPDMTLERIQTEHVGLKNMSFNMIAKVYNPNTYPFKFKQMSYRMDVNGETLAQGRVDSLVNIPAKDTATVITPVELKPSKAFASLYALLFKPADTQYAYSFECKTVSNSKMIDNSRMAFSAKGNLKDVVQTVKAARKQEDKAPVASAR